ncbi:hypothetical protein HXY32_01460 [Candidatus Bathyarchaeota archaeon]|nr:hypothetical protein [Candidatus Bathyarchaeota archaeon]
MVNRDRHDIAMEILEKAKTGKKKTEIITEVGLSYLQSKQYLTALLDRGLLKIDEKNYFKTTKKGVEYLERCSECFLCDWHKQREGKLPRK